MIFLQADTSTDWFPSSGSLSSRSQKLIFACRKYFSHVWMNANKFQLITKKGGFLLMKTDLLDCRSVLSCHIRILLPGFGELLARGKCDIWSLSDSNWIRTHNTQFVSEHSTIQPKWLECPWLSVHVKCLWLYSRTSCLWVHLQTKRLWFLVPLESLANVIACKTYSLSSIGNVGDFNKGNSIISAG